MSCIWQNASVGKKFTLTELGLEDSRIRSKFEDAYSNKQLYEQKVPVNWVKKGWVQEVSI